MMSEAIFGLLAVFSMKWSLCSHLSLVIIWNNYSNLFAEETFLQYQ